jgi:hypothetical protein
MATQTSTASAERERLSEQRKDWLHWGSYLAERQWGTVREDYSHDSNAWNSFSHEHARSRAYRWGEDGLLGICDDNGLLCFSLALWNGKDPILKERPFGLTNPEGNHGEDVKECYYYLGATPSASYLKALYKYPQDAFPYKWLVEENERRSLSEREFELLDTRIFDGNRYFDVFIEYAKASPYDVLIRIIAHNRGPTTATLHLLPTLWFRNTWSWEGGSDAHYDKPSIRLDGSNIIAEHKELGTYQLTTVLAGQEEQQPQWLFTENETNETKLYGHQNPTPYVKDAFHEYLINKNEAAVNPETFGTKAAAYYMLVIPAGDQLELRLRLTKNDDPQLSIDDALGAAFEETFAHRLAEADIFYNDLLGHKEHPQDAEILRQACAGLIWSKQFYYYHVNNWLIGDPIFPPPPEDRRGRNQDWRHLTAGDVISMPDKWEFPWFAAWDLAFHAVAFSIIDSQFAKDQLLLMLNERYMHPNGQLAAYEWDFGAVNPPVHAWACRVLTDSAFRRRGSADIDFLEKVLVKLDANFTWWEKRTDSDNNNIFSGGFLGLDNIGVFDRSALPDGMILEQADGTAWMALFCLEMLRMSLELATHSSTWEDTAVKFFHHFFDIQSSINSLDGSGLWDKDELFYFDHVRANGQSEPLKVYSVVGLLPMIAALVFDDFKLQQLSQFAPTVLNWFVQNDNVRKIERLDSRGNPVARWLIAIPSHEQLCRILKRLFDEGEFLSPYGIRSLSKVHQGHPFVLHNLNIKGEADVYYVPGESDNRMFAGNSNWRGPIWFPVNLLLMEALGVYYHYYGDDFKVEFPTGSGNWVTLLQARNEIGERLLSIFRPNATGHRPVHGEQERYASDPNWKDLILFNEYFHGDNGRGCGASHQTGWTALAAVIAWVLARRSQPDM